MLAESRRPESPGSVGPVAYPPVFSATPPTDDPVTVCLAEPFDAIRVVADSIGGEARRRLLVEAIRTWVDEIPDQELFGCYADAVGRLGEGDLAMLAAWHAALDVEMVGVPVASMEYLVGTFPELGDHRREALRLATAFRDAHGFEPRAGGRTPLEAMVAGITADQREKLARTAIGIYIRDRLGSEN